MDDRGERQAAIFARVVEALPPTFDRGKVEAGTQLRRDLGLDSLGLASFLFRCGEALGLDQDALIEALSGAALDTIGDLAAALASAPASARHARGRAA